jgi:cysteine desulfurase family protein
MNTGINYFDNAATTFPKPQSVNSSALECMEEYCGNPGRGSHILALRSSERVFMAREAVASLFNASPENVIFTLNTTYALNMAIKGVMKRGGHALISNMEHNAVLRPVDRLLKERCITYDIFESYSKNGDNDTKRIISEILKRLRRDTRLLVCNHASNVCSFANPIREIGKLCRRYGIIFCVDAAQSAGHIPIDMVEDNIDILCLPGHKGLYAPQGCGIMILRDGLEIETLVEGGNGINSKEVSMGHDSPERYESGTLCTPAIAGLYTGVEFIKNMGIERIAEHERSLWNLAYEHLSAIGGITVYDKTPGPVLLFNVDGLHPDDVGRQLAEKGYCLRSGYHCAPLAHQALGTPEGGALRIGFGIFNDREQTISLCNELEIIAHNMI